MATEQASVIDLAAEDDSVVTTATIAAGKKTAKGKKVAAGKGKKSRAKQDEAVEVAQVPEPEDDDFEVKVTRPPKANSSRKRKSEHMEDTITKTEAPAPKRRNTRTRGSLVVDDSTVEVSTLDTSIATITRKPAKPRGRQGGRRSTRSSRGTSSVRKQSMDVTNDDELDRALQADLDMRLSDEEDVVETVLPKKRGTRSSHIGTADHVMFGVEPMQIDEAAIETELELMEVESKPLPKDKGKAKQPRKVSAKQQAAARKAAEAAADAEAEAQRMADEASQQIVSELEHSMTMQKTSPIIPPKRQRTASGKAASQTTKRNTRASHLSVDESNVVLPYASDNEGDEVKDGYETDASMASQATIVKEGFKRRGSTLKKGRAGKKEAANNIEEVITKPKASSKAVDLDQEEPIQPASTKLQVTDRSMTEDVFYTPVPEPSPAVEEPSEVGKEGPKRRGRPRKAPAPASDPQAPAFNQDNISHPRSTPARTKVLTPDPSRSATPPGPAAQHRTPSRSPQSSDAENQPPSSRPSLPRAEPATPHAAKARIPLAVTTSTPMLSPSKRNIIAGLQTIHPWTAVDLDVIFSKSPNDENAGMLDGAMQRLKNGQQLSEEERGMTVEEWIHYNASLAEEKLRSECEAMVGCFEREGGRAMRALEGVACLE